jgi:hypothetical protein
LPYPTNVAVVGVQWLVMRLSRQRTPLFLELECLVIPVGTSSHKQFVL